jgi:hypothetical protein
MFTETDHRPVADVLRDLNDRLTANGVEAGEYLFTDATTLLPGDPRTVGSYRWLVCYPVRGGSEGFYVHLAEIADPSDRRATRRAHRLLGIAKTWTADSAWEIACATARHLDIV